MQEGFQKQPYEEIPYGQEKCYIWKHIANYTDSVTHKTIIPKHSVAFIFNIFKEENTQQLSIYLM